MKKNNKKRMRLKKKSLIIIVSFLVILLIIAIAILVTKNKKETPITNKCLVQFQTSGGTNIEEKNIICGEKIQEPEKPTKEGFTFVGWRLVGDYYDFNKPIEKDIILVAEWQILEETKIVKVYFNTMGGTMMAPIEIAKGSTMSKPLNPKKEGYEFVEWTLNEKTFDFNTNIDEEITLVAKWEESSKKTTEKTNNNQKNNNSSAKQNSSSPTEQDNCGVTLSGAKSCISTDLSWDAFAGTWFLKGTDDVRITFTETDTEYSYQGKRFDFSPSKVGGGQGGSYLKSMGYSPTSIALSINVTDITGSYLTIDNKYVFYREANYPKHIETDEEKMFNNILGTWYLDGYSTDVWVRFKEIDKQDEQRIISYDYKDFCSTSGLIYPTKCNDVSSIYYMYSILSELKASGWSYESGYLYNSSSGKKLRFSKKPTDTSVENVTLNKNDVSLLIGESETLIATIMPSNATNKDIIWSSDDTSIATVTDGIVKAKSAGTTIIKATTKDGKKTATCTVNVNNIKVEGISLNKNSLSLTRGNKTTLTATITPSDATNKNITWKSNDPSVVTVDNNGKVNAVGKGKTKIIATTQDGNKTAICEVIVFNPILSAKASIGITTSVTSSGTSKGVSVEVTPSGGTGIYTYYYIKLYKDNELIGETTNTSSNKLFLAGYTNGVYYAEFEVKDSDGTTHTNKSGKTTISGY